MSSTVSDLPIFIMGSDRSGSNLLRVLLGNHSNISAPRALQLLISFCGLIPLYGSLSKQENVKDLFDDCMLLVNHPYHFWNLRLNFDCIFEKYRPKCFLDIFHLLYSEYMIGENKKRFACKENNIFDFADQLANYYKDSKFIYLYRDPRDYVASWMKFPVGPKTPFLAAIKWLEEQRKCDLFINSSNLEVYRLKFEDLIKDTRAIMTELLVFLNEPIEEACFNIQEGSHSDLEWNLFWENLNKPIMKQNFKKYREVFTKSTIDMIETVTKECMIRLVYEFDTQVNWKRSRFFKYREAFLAKLSDFRRKRTDNETLRRLSSRKELMRTIVKKRKPNS